MLDSLSSMSDPEMTPKGPAVRIVGHGTATALRHELARQKLVHARIVGLFRSGALMGVRPLANAARPHREAERNGHEYRTESEKIASLMYLRVGVAMSVQQPACFLDAIGAGCRA